MGKRSATKLAGTLTTFNLKLLAAAILLITWFCFTPIATGYFTLILWCLNAGCFSSAFRELEPYAGKLARPVLRGERGREAPDLPDQDAVTQNPIADPFLLSLGG